MRIALPWIAPIVSALALSSVSFAQTSPAPHSASAPATASSLPKNLDRTLDALVTIDASHTKLSEFIDLLRDMTQTNLVPNWNALAQSGITRDTPVDLHLKDLPYEHVIKTLIEILPATATRPNYTVGDNILALTTNADLGKGNVSGILDASHAINYSLGGALTDAERQENAALVEKILRAELIRAGEPLDGKIHTLAIKDAALGATLSLRGHGILEHTLAMINAPLKIGQIAGGTQLTAMAKKTNEALKAIPAPRLVETLLQFARAADKHPQNLNIALLPGTQEELAKPAPNLGYTITDGGVLLIGPREALAQRTVMAVYDLRDIMRRLITRNTKKPAPLPVEYQSAIVGILQQTVHPDGTSTRPPATAPQTRAGAAPSPPPPPGDWGTIDDLGKKPACLIPYNGLLIVLATPETHRTLAAALQDIYK